MNKKIVSLFIISFAVIFLSGCGEESPSTSPTSQQQQEQVIKKQPSGNIMDEALLYCSSQGYKISFVVNSETQESVPYCVFDTSTACPALLYYRGNCTQQTAMPLSPTEISDDQKVLRYCDVSTQPVCGMDRKTYANRCIAEVQGIEIASDGACPDLSNNPGSMNGLDSPSPEGIPDSNGSSSSGSSGSGQSSGSNSRPGGASSGNGSSSGRESQSEVDSRLSWVDILILALDYEKRDNPGIELRECQIGNTRVYYKTQGNGNGISVLYNRSGEVMCFPSNDINNLCPQNYDASCKVIWE